MSGQFLSADSFCLLKIVLFVCRLFTIQIVILVAMQEFNRVVSSDWSKQIYILNSVFQKEYMSRFYSQGPNNP